MAAYFALAIGAVALVAAVMLGLRARHLRSYVPIRGQVVEKWVGPASTTSAGVSDGTRFEAHVRYAYTVDGTEYVGERIALTKESSNRASAERQLERYDGDVTVYVDPADPNAAVLTRSGLGLAVFTGLVGVVAIVIGLAVLVG
jgi:hypothetical protein